METNTNVAADAEPGLQARISLTTGNTMAPCVIIGELAGEILKADHKL
jgi:hypothetical protein